MQRGYIFQAHGAWHVRYRLPNGKQKCERLAAINEEYRTVKSVRLLAEEKIHHSAQPPPDPSTLQQFVESLYLPHIKIHREPSTYRGYVNLFNAHLRPHVGGLQVVSFRTSDGQGLMNQIATKHDLSHLTLVHIKSFLSGVFTFARRMDSFNGSNPMQGVEVPKGRQSEDTYAYSNVETEKMLLVLEGVAHVAVTVAAYTGLSLSELKGLQWSDVVNDELKIQRKVWHGIEGKPKTKARKDSIPLLPIVNAALNEHRHRNPTTKWVFEGPYVRPLDMATLGSKQIKTTLKAAGVEWRGWHALRRGFATRLHEAGVQDKIIQSLMRHSSLSVTMKHYVKATPEANVEAMKKLNPRGKRK